MDIETVVITKEMRIRAAEILWPQVRQWLIDGDLTETLAEANKTEFIKIIINYGIGDDGYTITRAFDDWNPDFELCEILNDYVDLLWDKSREARGA